jgi:hypothetical protein
MLRVIVLAYGLLSVLGAIVLLILTRSTPWLAVYLGVNGIVLVGAVLFERRRYHTRADRTRGDWQWTGERFIDPTSGQLMEVFYNRATGERDYRTVSTQNET